MVAQHHLRDIALAADTILRSNSEILMMSAIKGKGAQLRTAAKMEVRTPIPEAPLQFREVQGSPANLAKFAFRSHETTSLWLCMR